MWVGEVEAHSHFNLDLTLYFLLRHGIYYRCESFQVKEEWNNYEKINLTIEEINGQKDRQHKTSLSET